MTDPVTFHGEGPFWDALRDRLLCVDVLEGQIIEISSDGGVNRYDVPRTVATLVRRRRSGGFVVATDHDLLAADEGFSAFERIVVINDDPAVRTNDGGCDPLGAFVIGTMANDERAYGGAVYRVTSDHEVVEVLSPVSISNGVQWSAGGDRAFYIDTPTRRVDVFDVEPGTGTWSSRRPHIQLDCAAGFTDGMAIDEDDGIWVALWGGGAVHHYNAAGQLVEMIGVPGVSHVSSCAFGGWDRTTLYITTSRQGLPSDNEPTAGAIFAAQTNTRGAILGEYAG